MIQNPAMVIKVKKIKGKKGIHFLLRKRQHMKRRVRSASVANVLNTPDGPFDTARWTPRISWALALKSWSTNYL